MIIDTSFIEGPPQIDGRRYVKETHTDDRGKTYEYEWLGDQDITQVIEHRRNSLNDLIARDRAAQELVFGTKLPLTKYQFRQLFTQPERVAIDAFESTFETNASIDSVTKSIIRSGLKDFNAAQDIARPFVAEVIDMLSIFAAIGLITNERKDQIVSNGNG